MPALRGGLESANFYITRTELHESLARAWESAGRPDSAAVHWAFVAHAWAHADPELQPRVRHARARVAALRSPRVEPARRVREPAP